MTLRWQITNSAEPALRRWGDEYVVHHRMSNDTYRLSASAGRILAALLAADAKQADDSGGHATTDDAEAGASLAALAELGFVSEC